MTHHVRAGYRHHRKATLGVATVLVVAIAAIVIPLANAAEKTYTLTVNPSTLCANASGGASTVVTLRNTGSPQTAGSAEVYFPAGSVDSVPPSSGWALRANSTSSASNGTKDIVARNDLNMAPGQSRTVSVTFKSSANFSTAVTAALKQSNQFNDSSGTANQFTVQGGFPTLRVVQCVTVSGRVYQDRNLDFGYVTGTAPSTNTTSRRRVDGSALREERRCARLVRGCGDRPGRCDDRIRTKAEYTFTGSRRSPTTRSASSRPPTTTDSSGPCRARPGTLRAARSRPERRTSAENRFRTSPDALTGQDFQVVPVVGPFGQGTAPRWAGMGHRGSKPRPEADHFYVQDTWVDQKADDLPVLARSCRVHAELLTEDLPPGEAHGGHRSDELAGQQAELKYDDVPPFLDGH